jgi:hypothetical protein
LTDRSRVCRFGAACAVVSISIAVRFHHVLAAALLSLVVAASGAAYAQARPADETQREQAFVEGLRREDPASADRYVALRDARAEAIAELRRVEAQYNAAGADLRAIFTRPLVQARRKYAETSLALLDFYDERDRATVKRYQGEIERINALSEERSRMRADLEKLKAP